MAWRKERRESKRQDEKPWAQSCHKETRAYVKIKVMRVSYSDKTFQKKATSLFAIAEENQTH